MNEKMLAMLDDYPLPKLDDFRAVPSGKRYEEVVEGFKKLIKSLSPGLTEIIFHPSIESETLPRITNSWRQRNWEARLFSDQAIIDFLHKEAVLFTDWREIMRRHKEK